MRNLIHTLRLKHWSTYMAFATWGATGFMAQPTLASGVVHLFLTPVMLVGVIGLAHHEGRMKAFTGDRVRPEFLK
jgi:hypothetical protein